MQPKLCNKCLLVASMMLMSLGFASASVQSFGSDIGTIEVNLPYNVELGQYSSGAQLDLVKVGTTKPIISIGINDAALYKNLQDFAKSFIGEGYSSEKMVTDDGKPMLFNVEQTGSDNEGNPTYRFRGFVDYSKENGKYIIMHAPNNVRYQGETIATYTKEQFAAICQSFTIK